MASQAVFSKVLAKTLPDALQFDLPKESVYAERETLKLEPAGGYSSYGPRTTAVIHVPAIDKFMDSACTYLSFDITVPLNDKYALPACGAHGLIQTVRLFHQSGTLIDEIEDYNLLMATQASLSVEADLRSGALQVLQGMAGSSGLTVLSTTKRRLMIPIKNIFFANSKLLGLKYVGGLRLEIVWADGREVLVQADTSPVVEADREYTITDLCLYTSMVRLNDNQVSAYDQIFRERGLSLYGSSYRRHLAQWATRDATITVSDRSASMKDLTVVFRDNTTVSSTLDASRNIDKLHARANKVSKYQFSIAGKLFPTRPVDGSIEALAELFDANHGNVGGWDLTMSRWTHSTNGSFVVMREMETSRQLVSGDTTCRDKAVDIQLIVQGNTDTPACRVHVFVHRDKIIRFDPTGAVEIYE